jgi:hypothetical protein
MDKVPMKSSDQYDLEQKIMDSNIAKSESEWWACNEIAKLRQQVAALTAQRDMAVDALSELHDIAQGVIDDGKAPQGLIDSFTLQPAREALAATQSSEVKG